MDEVVGIFDIDSQVVCDFPISVYVSNYVSLYTCTSMYE